MKIVGLTGGIGSGKSTVAKMFEQFGVAVYYADSEAKKLMNLSPVIKKKLEKEFGEDTYKNGKLNRKYLADIIFNQKDKLKKINSIVHPEVEKHFKTWVNQQKGNYVIQENAILFENNKQDKFDYIITVTAPKDIRIDRVINRDKTNKKQVISRMNNQLNDSEKIKKSDFIIQNVHIEDTQKQVKKIHFQLENLSKS